MRLKIAAFSLLILTISASCGGEDGSGSTNAGGAAQTETVAAADRAADQAAADGAILKLSDMPNGWQGTAPKPEDEDVDKNRKKLFDCVSEPDPGRGYVYVESMDFSDSDDAAVSSTIAMHGDAKSIMNAYQNPAALGCLEKLLNEQLGKALRENADDAPKGVEYKLGKPTFGVVNFPAVGDQSIAYRYTVPVTAGPFNVTLYMDTVIARKGRALITITSQDMNSPFDAKELERITRVVVDRLPT